MRRFIVLLSVVVVVLLDLATTGGLRTAAQEATPAAAPSFTVGSLAPIGEPFELLPGVTIEFLNEGQPAAASDHTLVLYRVTIQPGGVGIPSHIHPGATALTVEEGSFTWTLQAGTVRVTRPGQTPEDVTESGTELILSPGEGLSYNDDVVHIANAGGDGPVSVLVASLFETGQPVFMLTDEHGTPTP